MADAVRLVRRGSRNQNRGNSDQMKRAVPRKRLCLSLCLVRRCGIPAALAHGLHPPSYQQWVCRSQTPMLPGLQMCSCLLPRRSNKAIPPSCSCDSQPNQSSWAAGSFVWLIARLWWATLCGYLEMRKQREHGVDGHMSARRNRRTRAVVGMQVQRRAVAVVRSQICMAGV